MNNTPEISVVVPIYNSEDLEACLNSVKNQTFNDFECICVDDGSTNGCLETARRFAAEDKRFRLIEQSNCGCSAARNAGIKTARGRYLAFIDHDDVYHPQALELLRWMLLEHNADVSCFNLENVPKDFVLQSPEFYQPSDLDTFIIDTPFEAFFKHKKCRQVEVWRRMYKLDLVHDIEFPVGIQPGEDDMFNIKVMAKIKRQVVTSKPLIYYRASHTSVMKKGMTEKYVRSYLKSAEIYDKYFKNLSKDKRKLLDRFISRKLYMSCIAEVIRKSKDSKTAQALTAITRPELVKLHNEQIFKLRYLGLRRQIICRLFFAGHISLVNLMLKMHKPK